MNINKLIGLRLESCRFSKGSYTLELDGKVDEKHYNIEISTSCYLSFSNSSDKNDVCSEFSLYIWDMLETDLVSIALKEEENEIEFEFENNKKIIIWADESLIDNLMTVENTKTGEWSVVG
jgi:hypothetical protein